MTPPQPPTLAILAGGAGSRMGIPKAWLTIRGIPILQYLHTRLDWPGPTLLVTTPTREHPPAHELFDREACDDVPDQGPLRALVTALESATTDQIIAIPCDMPLLEQHHLLWLADQLHHHPSSLGLMLSRAIGSTATLEPFPCALRRSAAPLLRQRLESRDRSVHSLAKHPSFTVVSLPLEWDDQLWTNLNDPGELHRFEHP